MVEAQTNHSENIYNEISNYLAKTHPDDLKLIAFGDAYYSMFLNNSLNRLNDKRDALTDNERVDYLFLLAEKPIHSRTIDNRELRMSGYRNLYKQNMELIADYLSEFPNDEDTALYRIYNLIEVAKSKKDTGLKDALATALIRIGEWFRTH